MSSTPDLPPPDAGAFPATPLPAPAPAPAWESVMLPTLPERIAQKVRSARDVVDPPTPVRILISGALLAAVVYLAVHLVHGLLTDDWANPAIFPLYWAGIAAVNVLDLGWTPKKQKAKLERRRAESAGRKEAVAAHNARVAAQLPPASPAHEPTAPHRAT